MDHASSQRKRLKYIAKKLSTAKTAGEGHFFQDALRMDLAAFLQRIWIEKKFSYMCNAIIVAVTPFNRAFRSKRNKNVTFCGVVDKNFLILTLFSFPF